MTIENQFTDELRADWIFAEVPHISGLYEVVVKARTPFKILTGFVYVSEGEDQTALYIRTPMGEAKGAEKYFAKKLRDTKSVATRVLTYTDEKTFSGVRISGNNHIEKPLAGIKHFTREYLAFCSANYFQALFKGLKLTPLPFL